MENKIYELCKSFIIDLQGFGTIILFQLQGLTYLPSDAFSGLDLHSSLDFYNNDLRTIHSHAFRGIQSGITTLDFKNCNLTEFPGEALSSFTNLRTLRLTSNQITHIPDGSFRPFSQLRELYLENNPLGNINREELLSGLESSLHTLNLQNLNITSFPSALLRNLSGLAFVALNNNLIETLPANMLEGFRTTFQLSLVLSHNRIYNVSPYFLRGTNITLGRINFSHNRLTNLDFLDVCLPPFDYHHLGLVKPSVKAYGNPLQCDCDLLNLLNQQEVAFRGQCVEHKVLRDMSFLLIDVLMTLKQQGHNITKNNEKLSCPNMESINCTDSKTDITTGNGGPMTSSIVTAVYIISIYAITEGMV